jgi:hypothetical protein
MKPKRKPTKEKTYKLCEAVADIAYIAGTRNYYGGNSRQDIEDFIHWAEEFELKWKNKEWGADETDDDYIDEITKFANEKINASNIYSNE